MTWSVFCVPSNPYSIFSIIDGVKDKRVIIYANRFNYNNIVDNITTTVSFHKDSVEITMNKMYKRVMMNIKYIDSNGHIEVDEDSTYVYGEDEDGHYMTPPTRPHPEYGERWALSRFFSVLDSDEQDYIYNLFRMYARPLVDAYFKYDGDDDETKMRMLEKHKEV